MEKITKLVLRRPVTTLLAIISLIFFGFMALANSKLELMFNVNYPMMIITTTYPGAAPEDVDRLVTKKIEEGAANLSDVKTISSQSNENYSLVMVRYNYGTDMSKAYDELKKKVDALKSGLPKDAEEPSFVSLDMNEQASMVLAVNNPSQANMYNYVKTEITPKLEKLSSVASVSASGGQEQYVKVELIPEKLSQYHLSMAQISQAISSADFSYPAGTTGVGSQELSVTTGVSYDNVDRLRELPITTGTGDTLYLRDVAVIGTTLKEQTAIGRYNGNDTVTLSITKTQKDSAVTLSRAVKAQLETLRAQDKNLEIIIIDDSADTILSSLSSVFQTMIMAIVISMAIIFLFFGDWKASLIVGTSIPIAILGALVFMWGMGYSLNMITLSALVLGVGMMVDNSIVVLEACFRAMDRYRDANGRSRREAAVDSIRTVGTSVFGSTLTTCVVFLPLGFLQGLSGQFFAPLGFTIVFCMAASLLSAISIVPLTYVMYRPRENTKAPAYGWVRAMQGAYRGIVTKLLRHKAAVVLSTLAMVVISLFLATQIRMEMMPQTDEGTVNISVETRPGLKLSEVDEILKEIETQVAADPDTDRYMVTSGGSSIFSSGGNTVTQYLRKDRSMKTAEKVKVWKKELQDITNAVVTVDASSMMSSMSTETNGYEAILEATDYTKLKESSDAIVRELQARPDVTAVHSTLENSAPLVKIQVDPIRAAAEGLVPVQIGQSVNAILSGAEAMKMDVDGQSVSVKVEYPDSEYDDLEKVQNIMLTTPSGKQVKLDNVADIRFEDSPASISRSDRRYQATVTASFTDAATQNTRRILDEEVLAKHLNEDVTTALNSSTESMNEEFRSLGNAILIAVFLVFVVMAAQFESMRYSFMVMTTIPLSLIGSFGLLWLFDVTLSMTSLLGFLMLVGTVVNNGILYVDTVNQYREEMPLNRALVEAGATRLRPILMTTLTTVISMVPMAVGFGDNGAMMQGLAMVDVGGLLASTILSLLMLPIYYYLMTGKKRRQREIPAPGYMEGKNPEAEYRRRREEERSFRQSWEYSEGESFD